MLTDAAGTVLAPPERLRTTIARTPGFVAASAEHDTVHVVSDNGAWEIVAPVRGEVATGSSARTIVGWVWLRYDPSVIAHEAVSPWLRAIAGIFWLGVAGMIVAAGGWWLVVRPLRALREETELAVTGSVDEVEPIVKFGPLEDLAHSINRAVRRARR
jgi:hypothetical protein